MICNVILLDKFLKNRKAQIARNILTSGIRIWIEIYPMNEIVSAIQGYSHFRVVRCFFRLGNNAFYHMEILVVHRVFAYLAVKFLP